MLYNNDVFGKFIDPESNPMFDQIQLKNFLFGITVHNLSINSRTHIPFFSYQHSFLFFFISMNQFFFRLMTALSIRNVREEN